MSLDRFIFALLVLFSGSVWIGLAWGAWKLLTP